MTSFREQASTSYRKLKLLLENPSLTHKKISRLYKNVESNLQLKEKPGG